MLTEICNKGSIINWLKKESLTWKIFLDLSKQISSGLIFLKSCSIVHRDLSAKNVCVDEIFIDGTKIISAKIIDFGLGRIHRIRGDSARTFFWSKSI